jgi:hypothetical protein
LSDPGRVPAPLSAAADAAPWQVAQINLTATGRYANPYAEVDVWAEFVHDDGTVLRRPAFHDGAGTWRIRFASPLTSGTGRWRTDASTKYPGLPPLSAA